MSFPKNFHRLQTSILTLILFSTFFAASASADTLIHAGKLIDSVSDSVHSEKTIVVRDGRIAEIADGYRKGGDDDTVIDLKDSTVMAGFMDMHTHLSSQSSPASYLEGPRLPGASYAIRGVVYAERTLMAGFTTVRDVGDRFKVSMPLRDAINQGFIPGPRMYTAGTTLASTGGHGDSSNGLRDDLAGDPSAFDGVVNGVESARKAVRQRYKDGVDLIKITATGGVLSMAKNGRNPQFSEAELRAIVEIAADYGFHVAAHAHGAEGMNRAIRAGVRSIEHGTFMSDETIALMKEHGTYFVPTISAGRFVAEKAEIPGYYPEVVRPKAAATGPQMDATFAKAYKAGVKIALGTDCGVSPHGDNAKEFQYMVENGMPAMEAIRAGTMATAELLGIEEDLGSLEAGKIADIVAVEGDPLNDIKILQDVRFVMKDGVVYKND